MWMMISTVILLNFIIAIISEVYAQIIADAGDKKTFTVLDAIKVSARKKFNSMLARKKAVDNLENKVHQEDVR